MIAALMVVTAAQAAAPVTGSDFVRYEVGGLMSGPYRLQVDLDTGDAEEEAVDRPGQGAVRSTKRYRLADNDLSSVRRGAAALILHDATAARCRRPGHLNLPPTMDALINLYVRYRGKDTAAGPDPSCLSTEADRFLNSLRAVIKRTSVRID